MLETIIRNMLADLGMTPEQLQEFVVTAQREINDSALRIKNMEAQLERIEKMLCDDRADKSAA